MTIDTTICPLCGKANHCEAAANGNQPVPGCWCKDETFPQELLDQVPDALKLKTCICRDCVRSFMDAR